MTTEKKKIVARVKDDSSAQTLSEGTNKTTFGRTFWDVLSGLSQVFVKRPVTVIGLMLLLGGGGFAVAWHNGLKINRDKDGNISVELPGTTPTSTKPEGDKNKAPSRVNYEEMEKQAIEKGLPYIILSITDRNRLELETINGERKLMLYRNITYVVRALRKIEKNDNVFIEQYYSSETTPKRRPGTESEVEQTGGTWSVELEMEAGEIRTVTTGAVFPYSLPLKANRAALGEQIHPGQNEQFLSYPNSADFVGEIVMQVESNSLDLQPVGAKAARRYNKDLYQFLCDNVVQQTTGEVVNTTSLSARWLNVKPNQEVGIDFLMRNLDTGLAMKPSTKAKSA